MKLLKPITSKIKDNTIVLHQKKISAAVLELLWTEAWKNPLCNLQIRTNIKMLRILQIKLK